MRPAALVLFLCICLLAWTDSRADVLGDWTREEFVGSPTEVTEMGLQFGVGTDPFLTPTAVLFDGILFNENHVGNTVTATSGSSEDFVTIVDLLTNGKDGFALLCRELPTGTGCSGTTESMAFGWDPDFAGATIEQISLTINRLEFKTPGYKGATDIDLNVTFTIEGTPVTVESGAWSTLKARY